MWVSRKLMNFNAKINCRKKSYLVPFASDFQDTTKVTIKIVYEPCSNRPG